LHLGKVHARLTDKKLHDIIDRLNPSLRSVENHNGRTRKREFYAMSAEEAYNIFDTIAEINDLKENLVLVSPSKEDLKNASEASEIREKRSPIKKPGLKHLLKWGIVNIGETLYYHKHEKETAVLLDEAGNVEFNGKVMKYMQWGREVLKFNNFNFYDYAHRLNANKSLSEERLEYMIDNNILLDVDFND